MEKDYVVVMVGTGLILVALGSLLVLKGCSIEAMAGYDKKIDAFIFEDGCIVSNDLKKPEVLNPDECPDKNLVKYLNCSETILMVPSEQRPAECK